MGKHLSGGKFSSSHTSVIDAAERVAKRAAGLESVTKVALGVITPGLPVGVHRIKCSVVLGGLKVVVRGTHSKQELYVYTKEAEYVESILYKSFGN